MGGQRSLPSSLPTPQRSQWPPKSFGQQETTAIATFFAYITGNSKQNSPVIFFCTIRLEAVPSLLLLPSTTPLRSPWLQLGPPLTSRSLSRSELHMDVDGEDTSDEWADDKVEAVDEGDMATTWIVRTWAALLSVITGPGPLLLLLLLRLSSSGGTRSQTYLASGDRIGWSALKSKPHRLVASSTCFFSCVSTMLRVDKIMTQHTIRIEWTE